ncbi:hypothetical protein LTR40_005398 [Exophiala xenobiotica]|nr:hypothetical protein LTR40_005398 [Exophiala xenobiotica]
MFTDLFLYGLVVPVLPFMLKERVHIPDGKIQSYVSGLLAAYAGASVIFSIPVGVIADRTNARQLPFLCGLAALLAATLMLAFGNNIAMLVIARLLQGTSAAVVWTVGLAMVLDTVGPENLGKVIGTIFSFISVGELAAPVLGGVLYRKTGYAGVFGLGSALLGLDFIMRLLVIEKKVAAKHDKSFQVSKDARVRAEGDEDDNSTNPDPETTSAGSEQDLLLPNKEDKQYAIPDATFDATIPTEAQALFGFDSLQAGLLFIALDIPYLLLGPIAGWCVDRYGTKPASVLGFGFLVPSLILLRLPPAQITPNVKSNIILYCGLLALNGMGLAVIGSPSIVESSDVVQRYDKANPGLFGENGPYAQLYAFNSLVFSAGLTIGPILSGGLKDAIGYGNMNIVVACISGITALLSFFFVGGKPKIVGRRSK